MPKEGFSVLTLKDELVAKIDELCLKEKKSRPEMIQIVLEEYEEEHQTMQSVPQ